MKPLDQYEVWFLTGSQELYGEATLRQVAADAEQIARSLGDAAAIHIRAGENVCIQAMTPTHASAAFASWHAVAIASDPPDTG